MQNERSIFSGDRVVNRYQHFSSTLQQGLRFVFSRKSTQTPPSSFNFHTHTNSTHTYTHRITQRIPFLNCSTKQEGVYRKAADTTTHLAVNSIKQKSKEAALLKLHCKLLYFLLGVQSLKCLASLLCKCDIITFCQATRIYTIILSTCSHIFSFDVKVDAKTTSTYNYCCLIKLSWVIKLI